MQRNKSFFLPFVLLLILNTSCKATTTTTATTAPEHPIHWWTSWLDQPVCKPPCWQNITPGLTTMDEALSILENTANLIVTFKSEDGVDWVFRQNEDEGGTLGTSRDGIVAWLVNTSDSNLYLEKIITFYDHPEYVKPYDCREGMCSTVLVYPELGMLLSVFVENMGTINNTRIEILPNTIVNRVHFFEPGMENFQKLLVFQEYDLLMDWGGFGEYP